jgi:serpin B
MLCATATFLEAVMKTRLAWLLAGLAFGAGCSTSAEAPKPNYDVAKSSLARDLTPAVTAADQTQLTNDNASFAIDLYQAVRKNPKLDKQGIFLSPHSVSTALAMAYAGARGTTESEMAKALHFTLPQDRLHSAFDWLDLALESRGKNAKAKDDQPFRLRVANSMWGQKGFPFQQAFLDRLATSYGAGVNLVDFADSIAASGAINGWVEEKTENRIKDLVSPGALGGDTRFVLVNAVYFNAAWQSKFEKTATHDGTFTKLDGSTITASMMQEDVSLPYLHGETFDAVELPYDGGEMSMVLVAPAKGTFATYESTLTGESFRAVLSGLAPKQVKLTMPKFKEEGEFRLADPLKDLGMKAAFGPADFSGISTADQLYVSDVLHKTFLDIDENGTEAAAATAVVGKTTSVGPEPVTLDIDRPFFVAIIDRATKAIVFFGRVVEPKKS